MVSTTLHVRGMMRRTRRDKSSGRTRRTKEEDTHGRQIPSTKVEADKVTGDLRGEFTMVTLQCGKMMVTGRCGGTSTRRTARTWTRRAIPARRVAVTDSYSRA